MKNKKDNTKNKAKRCAFTLAEVLVTLSIIGIIAAILFPSILANYTERTLKAKRQALFGRMSQAMGELSDQFRNYESATNAGSYTDCLTEPLHCKDTGSALKFINEGLSTVYKLAAVCDKDSLSACDIPEIITREDGTTFNLYENGTSMFKYNPQVNNVNTQGVTMMYYDTDSAAFMTKNGESILLFYNPKCGTKLTNTSNWFVAEAMMCVNMVYDLNGGKNKPNKMGEDIGFMTVFYNDQPYVTAPKPYDFRAVPDYNTTTNSSGETENVSINELDFWQAKAACAALGDNVGLPSMEEAFSMVLNRELWSPISEQVGGGGPKMSEMGGYYIWTSTMMDPTHAGMVFMPSKYRMENNTWNHGFFYYYETSFKNDANVRCVYKD